MRFQWDPDRDLTLRRLDHRAIQLGLSGGTVRQYVREWIIGLEDVTSLAQSIRLAIEERRGLPCVSEESVYPLDAELRERLRISE